MMLCINKLVQNVVSRSSLVLLLFCAVVVVCCLGLCLVDASYRKLCIRAKSKVNSEATKLIPTTSNYSCILVSS
jgi:hypothetical protein